MRTIDRISRIVTGRWAAIGLVSCLFGCAATQPPAMSEGHLQGAEQEAVISQEIPDTVSRTGYLPPPLPPAYPETYTVVVNDVPLKELLFSLARDAKLNVDIHPALEGNVTLNAINQTLPQILHRLSEQVALTFELNGNNLTISPDKSVLRTYKVDYVGMTRNATSSVTVATSIATIGGSVGQGGSSSDSGNTSSTSVTSNSAVDFWPILAGNIESILAEGAPPAQGSSGRVIVNPLGGVISVLATERQHRRVQQFIDQVLSTARRQVLIEATIVEVELGDRYQAGIDWSWVQRRSEKTLSAVSSMLGGSLAQPPTFVLGYDRQSGDTDLTAAVKLLESFGDAKVLSSPKIIAMNNQTALLKVVDEKVYFSLTLEIEEGTDGEGDRRTYTSEIHTVPVGVILSVTPLVNETGSVTLSVRPSISRITGFVADPAVQLTAAASNSTVPESLVPEIQVREMESLLQVRSGQTVMLGGLMQNKEDKNTSGLPWLSRLPVIGPLFRYKDDTFTKTELVIFLRPVLADEANLRATATSQNLLPSWSQAAGAQQVPGRR